MRAGKAIFRRIETQFASERVVGGRMQQPSSTNWTKISLVNAEKIVVKID